MAGRLREAGTGLERFRIRWNHLPRRIWFDPVAVCLVRSTTTHFASRLGLEPNPPGPAGFKRRAAHGVGRLDHIPDMLCAALLLDRRAF